MIWADRVGAIWLLAIGALLLIAHSPDNPPSNPLSMFLLIFGPWLFCRALDFIFGGPFRRHRDRRYGARHRIEVYGPRDLP